MCHRTRGIASYRARHDARRPKASNGPADDESDRAWRRPRNRRTNLKKQDGG